MGYTTEFSGEFILDKTLADEHREYLHLFSETRRMKRDPEKAVEVNKEIREAVGLPVGEEGAFVCGLGFAGQDHDESITEYNCPPKGQPGLWCQWIPTADGDGIEWDGSEKFYEYTEWLKYLVENFLKPWGYTLNGEVEWRGEDRDDMGKIVVKDNEVSELYGEIFYS